MGFQGMKRLNRIQSIVFDAAYNTNENLLISAPTGAGKTNIAMLTILREIKQNIEEGVIKKDKFKVGYLLPFIITCRTFRTNFRKKNSENKNRQKFLDVRDIYRTVKIFCGFKALNFLYGVSLRYGTA